MFTCRLLLPLFFLFFSRFSCASQWQLARARRKLKLHPKSKNFLRNSIPPRRPFTGAARPPETVSSQSPASLSWPPPKFWPRTALRSNQFCAQRGAKSAGLLARDWLESGRPLALRLVAQMKRERANNLATKFKLVSPAVCPAGPLDWDTLGAPSRSPTTIASAAHPPRLVARLPLGLGGLGEAAFMARLQSPSGSPMGRPLGTVCGEWPLIACFLAWFCQLSAHCPEMARRAHFEQR